ncbi:MAG: hypothetical protein ACI8UO_001378 [Verrucomicrobiales bacterium]|jgi:hypothetical protein
MKVTKGMTASLQGARGWVSFLGILGFAISFAALAVCGVAIYWAAAKADVLSKQHASLFIVAGALLFNALLAIYPATRLMVFGDSCTQFAVTRSPNALYKALIEHRKFWQFWGIFTLVAVVLNGVVLILLAISGGFAEEGGLMEFLK